MTDTTQIYITKIFLDKLQELNENLSKLNGKNIGMKKYYLSTKTPVSPFVSKILNEFIQNGFTIERFDLTKEESYIILGSVELTDKEYEYLMHIDATEKEMRIVRTDIFARFKVMKEMIANENAEKL